MQPAGMFCIAKYMLDDKFLTQATQIHSIGEYLTKLKALRPGDFVYVVLVISWTHE